MTLYLIGLGLENQYDITLKGLNLIRSCDIIYLENYTSLLQCTKEDLETLYQKPIIIADRTLSENFDHKILTEAKTKNIAFLIIGDPVAATTHIELFKQAKQQHIPVQIIHNASILTAIGITGLQLYKFGRTISIPFLEDVPQLETPYHVIRENLMLEQHTLCLLDLKPNLNKFMTPNQALEILEHIEKRIQEKIITPELQVIACARLGTSTQLIKSGTIQDIKKIDFGFPPYCVIIPAKKLHFIEQEMLEIWK